MAGTVKEAFGEALIDKYCNDEEREELSRDELIELASDRADELIGVYISEQELEVLNWEDQAIVAAERDEQAAANFRADVERSRNAS